MSADLSPDDLCRLLSIPEAAVSARVSVRTVERWVAAEMIEPVDIGRAGRQKSTPWRYVDEQTVLEAERESWRKRHGKPAA